MMVANATETCRWILMYDKAHSISVHLLVCYVSAFFLLFVSLLNGTAL